MTSQKQCSDALRADKVHRECALAPAHATPLAVSGARAVEAQGPEAAQERQCAAGARARGCGYCRTEACVWTRRHRAVSDDLYVLPVMRDGGRRTEDP